MQRCDDPHERVRALIIEVKSCLRLIESIPLLETNFSGAQYLRKKNINECPKFLEIKYTLPPLNEDATSTARKKDVALYRIQMALANTTRPIDDYGNENLEFAHLMREMLSDVASSITQSKINNLHKSIEIPGRAAQLVGSTVKPLVEKKLLDALLAAKKPPTRSRKTKGDPFACSSRLRLAQYLQWHKPLRRHPKYCQQRSVILDINMHDNQEKILHDFSRLRRHLYAHSDTPKLQEISLFSIELKDLPILCPHIRTTLTELSHFYNSATPSTKLGPISRNQISAYLNNLLIIGKFKEKCMESTKKVYSKLSQLQYNIKKEKSNLTPFELILICDNDKLTNYEFKSPIRQGTKNVGCSSPWLLNAEETFGIEKQLLEEIEIIGCHGESEQSSNLKLRILETDSLQMDRLIPSSIVLAHINVKKLLAVYYALKPRNVVGCSILVYSDNTTRLAYVQKFGGTTSLKLLEVSEKLQTIETDSLKKIVLSTETFKRLCRIFGSFDVDLFATKLNRKLSKYYSCPYYCPVKTNPTDPTENSTDKNNNNNANVKDCNLVSESGENQDIRANTNTEQILVADGMGNERRTCHYSILQNEDLADLSLDLITVNTRYYSTQKDLIDWRHNIGISGDITAPDIIDYLSNIFIKRKLKQSTIKAYKSALLQLVTDKERILGPISNLNTKELTAKKCLPIAVCGNTEDFSKLLTVDNIPRIIKSITNMAAKEKKRNAFKARAIGITIAARTGISTNANLSQAN
ncbi:hypothetical protein BB561_005420 [Smittium simulii]|uniref:Uncharacterized protein n=1 Tax=Smittium simulii TaxID=133385 RepID=A0A2T9YAF7_9FUNG|nr:hypothetical protein BB561_005420 [Smittium simulii]